jgi:hypothetical protein
MQALAHRAFHMTHSSTEEKPHGSGIMAWHCFESFPAREHHIYNINIVLLGINYIEYFGLCFKAGYCGVEHPSILLKLSQLKL